MLIWVTSNCNLSCPLCQVKYTQSQFPNYEMSIEEVQFFISSSLERNIHYDTIEFAGGEPTIWSNLKQATRLIYDSRIADRITLISNGTNPEKIFEISNLLSYYAISVTQVPKDKLKKYLQSGNRIFFNNSKHIPIPTKFIEGTLPAVCCNEKSLLGKENNQLHYINGMVYYCCTAHYIGEHIKKTDYTCCSFTDDFVSHFADKKYDKRICGYCICNKKVWDKLHEV